LAAIPDIFDLGHAQIKCVDRFDFHPVSIIARMAAPSEDDVAKRGLPSLFGAVPSPLAPGRLKALLDPFAIDLQNSAAASSPPADLR